MIGVIGNGLRGSLARLSHRPDQGIVVATVCDINDENLARARTWYGNDVKLTGDYRDIVADENIDAVFVLTPDYLHEEHACAVLSAGKSVYLEKPMAISVEGCDRILRAAIASEGVLYVGHNMRHMAFVQTMKRLIDHGAIGEVQAIWCRHFVGYGGDFYFRDWHADRRFSNTLLLQKGSHDIDIIHFLAGAYTEAAQGFGSERVYAKSTYRREGPPPAIAWTGSDLTEHWPPSAVPGINPVVDVEDLSLVQLQLENGVLATYDQCHFTPDYWRNYTVIGDSGRLENFGNGEPGSVVKVWNRRCSYEAMGHVEVVPPPREGGHGGADEACVGEFLELISGERRSTITSPLAARAAVAAACAASSSIRAGGGVRRVEGMDPDLRRALEVVGTSSAQRGLDWR